MDLRTLQQEHTVWAQKNFDAVPPHLSLLGVVEELGELAEATHDPRLLDAIIVIGKLCHAELKSVQAIRTNQDHVAEAQDAVADLIIFTTDYATRHGWDLNEIVSGTWDKVKLRDWRANPATAEVNNPHS